MSQGKDADTMRVTGKGEGRLGMPVTALRPSQGWDFIDIRELWDYRELIYFFIWREVKVRYKQTIVGCAWAVIQPFFMMVVLSIFFGTLAHVPSDGTPYPVFAYAALLPWTLFSESVIRATNSLLRDANILRKVYFPRVVAPLAGVLSPLVDFAAAFAVFILIMLHYGFPVTARILVLPVFMALALVTAFGISLWLSALGVKYRDVQFAVPFLVQLWFFVSPVAYPSSMVPGRFHVLYGLNPMAGVVEGFRWALLGTNPPGMLMCVSAGIVAVILILGAFYFRRAERTFADYI